MAVCPHCLAANVSGRYCPVCGGELTWPGQKGLDLPVGITLNHGNRQYWIGAAKGRGGFGVTYAAMETRTQTRVAIKEYFPTRCVLRAGDGVNVQTFTGQEQVFRGGMNSFLREAQMLQSQGDLPSVVRVLDYFQANNTAYLVMEYLDGLPLHSYMNRMGGRIPAQDLLQKLEPVIRDLGILHRRGVLHRDISPDNMMWMPNGTIKLLDFGSARHMENGKSMTVLMKEGFSPIEQYRSSGQGPYTDIYALSATIYYCVTGVAPQGAVERLTMDKLRPPTDLGAAITMDQESAILWGLSVQPQARPQTMEEFHRVLYRKQQAPVSPGPIPPGPVPGPVTPGPVNPGPVPPGPVTPGPVTPGPAPRPQGGGNRLLIPIAAGAIAVIIIVAIAAIALVNGGRHGTVTAEDTRPPITPQPYHSSAPYQSDAGREPEPSSWPTVPPTTAPTPAPSPSVETGIQDGYSYEIRNGRYAVLTGYSGDDLGTMPDEINGVRVTEIADNAFAGQSCNGVANLPLDLERIGSGAFRGCPDLYYLYVYSDFTVEADSFAGTDLQVIVTSGDVTPGDWAQSCRIVPKGMQTAVGTVTNFTISGGIALYAGTDQGKGVLLDLIDLGSNYTLKSTTPARDGTDLPVEWIQAGALSRLSPSTTLTLPDSCLFDPLLYELVQWKANAGSLADMWLVTNAYAAAANAGRPSGAPAIVPHPDLMKAAQVRAEELSTKEDLIRPDGRAGFTALDDLGISYQYANQIRATEDSPRAQDLLDYITQVVSPAISGENAGSFAGEYYTSIGGAYCAVQNADGTTTYYCYIFSAIL